MKRKFRCEVTRTDEYIIEIDNEDIDKDLIQEYESSIHKLNGDKIKSLAKSMCYDLMDNSTDFYEGIGYVKKDNIGYQRDAEYEKGISIETISLEDMDIEIKEI